MHTDMCKCEHMFRFMVFFLFFEVPSENISSTLLQKILQTDIDLKFILSQSLAAEEIRTTDGAWWAF